MTCVALPVCSLPLALALTYYFPSVTLLWAYSHCTAFYTGHHSSGTLCLHTLPSCSRTNELSSQLRALLRALPISDSLAPVSPSLTSTGFIFSEHLSTVKHAFWFFVCLFETVSHSPCLSSNSLYFYLGLPRARVISVLRHAQLPFCTKMCVCTHAHMNI